MKILMTLYDIEDMGGIINTQEALYEGFKELGHKVSVRKLEWLEKPTRSDNVKPRPAGGEIEDSLLGGFMDQKWGNRGIKNFAYKGKENLLRWKDYASKFDLVLWQIPVESKAKPQAGNMDWLELYNIPTKQVVYIQDGNMWKNYPHITAVAHHFVGGAAVHPCSYNTLSKLPIPRAFIPAPHTKIRERLKAAHKSRKDRDGWLSLQTFKRWKHVDDIVRAVPYMGGYAKRLAGGGIERYYMTSPDKLKDEYRVRRVRDPNCKKSDIGRPIWTLASENGMVYYNFIANEHRERLLHRSQALIDPSYSLNYAEIGGDYFNRVTIDAAIAGAAPIARTIAMNPPNGGGVLFKPGKNYLPIPHNTTPRKFAKLVDVYLHHISRKAREMVVDECRELLPIFAPTYAANEFLKLARGREAGFFEKNIPGKTDAALVAHGKRLINNLFSGKPNLGGFFSGHDE